MLTRESVDQYKKCYMLHLLEMQYKSPTDGKTLTKTSIFYTYKLFCIVHICSELQFIVIVKTI